MYRVKKQQTVKHENRVILFSLVEFAKKKSS